MADPSAGEPEWCRSVKTAFRDSDLSDLIIKAATIDQDVLPPLFADIAHYVVSLRLQSAPEFSNGSKKRKLDEARAVSVNTQSYGTANDIILNPTTAYECADVSFQSPARKKLKLQIVADRNNTKQQELRLIQPATGDVDYALPVGQIHEVFCLPVPDKQQRQWNFLVFPTPGSVTPAGTPREQIVFTMNETAPTSAHSAAYTAKDGDTYITITELELARMLQSHGKRVIIPNADEFASSIPQSHRKGEKAYHVKAHRGNKEGYLFFLENGIVFGFKKPLSFFPFSEIDSISYTSVLQRTFNLVIAEVDTTISNATAVKPLTKEIEFSMLDQADFSGIDEYIKRHGLNDASMAVERRAKAYNVNKVRGEAAGANGEAAPNGDEANGGQTELQKAEQQLQDEEDEEEEDYEASGGESDGEGEYSSDEDGEDDGGDDDAEGDAEDDGEDDEVDEEAEPEELE